MKVEDRKQAAGAGKCLAFCLFLMSWRLGVYLVGVDDSLLTTSRTGTGTAAKHTAKRMYDPVREASSGLGN